MGQWTLFTQFGETNVKTIAATRVVPHLTNEDPADMLSMTDVHFEILEFGDSRGSPDPYLFSRDSFGGAAGAAGRILRSQPNPSPDAPRDQIRRKEPLLR